MSSTLFIRKTPTPSKEEWHFKLPIKRIIARKFYDHDGSCGGGKITVGPEHLEWFEGVLAGLPTIDADEFQEFKAVVEVLRSGGTIDMWFEV